MSVDDFCIGGGLRLGWLSLVAMVVWDGVERSWGCGVWEGRVMCWSEGYE